MWGRKHLKSQVLHLDGDDIHVAERLDHKDFCPNAPIAFAG